MAFQRLDGAVVGDLALMAFGTAMCLISFISVLVLVGVIYFVTASQGELPHPVSATAILIMLAMGGCNFAASIRLVNVPDRARAIGIVIRSMLFFAPVIAILIFT